MKETMKVKNPLSDFWAAKDGQKLTQLEANGVFIVHFLHDMEKGVYAFDRNLNKIKLGDLGAEHDKVDKIGGCWRIQNQFPYKITRIRDKDMVLMKKLNRVENTLFEFWEAKLVGYNCYGPFVFENNEVDYIVAKYETDNATYWGYGKTLESARAYLGIKIYDEYKDIIHAVACKNKMKRK